MSFQENFDFTNKVILVTGASSGIGRQTAISLSELGAKVVAVARREGQLQETISMMKGENHRYYCFDLKETDRIGDLMKQISMENGPLDGLAYCAGIVGTRPLQVSDCKFAEDTMRVNFFAFYEMVRQFVKKGRYAQNAKIVGISSAAGVNSPKGLSIYGASKAAMDNSVKALSKELLGKGININVVQPTFVKTDMYEEFIKTREGGGQYVEGVQPLGIIDPEDVAGMVIYLMSPLAKCITGKQMYIGG